MDRLRIQHWLSKTALVLIGSISIFGTNSSGAQESTLENVLSLAAEYVDQYQRDLGVVIAEEHYLQVTDGVNNRRLVSDLFVFSMPGEQEPWLAFRDVISVNGTPVEDRQQRLEDVFRESPIITGPVRRRLIMESARYNIGGISRNMNVPTMALQLLAGSDQHRFLFKKKRDRKIDEISVWEVEFEEHTAPALIKNGRGANLFSYGTVWIEPTTGRVIQTDFRAKDEVAELEIQMRVKYQADEQLGILVPEIMTERYKVRLRPLTLSPFARRNLEVNCEAKYSNFRRFEVQVDMGVDTPPNP
ncbi:MAG TPA: hypothetical protein DD460_03450 [Acidobacteria bacterium]|jgi:hypothetical protein|nr:hypothetical protein [Acidobacteriota bacterium]